jgi:hypothetical protein
MGYDVEGSSTTCYPVAFQDWVVSVLHHLGIRVSGAGAQGDVDVMAWPDNANQPHDAHRQVLD